MRIKNLAAIALAIAAMCAVGSANLDAKIYTLCESNISINLTPDFRLLSDQSSDASTNGLLIQSFTIAGTKSKGLGSLAIMEVYDEKMKALGPDAISQLFSGGISYFASSLVDTGEDNSLGNWSTLDNNGENVTVEILDTKGSMLSMFGKKANMAFWNLENDHYALLISSLDKNITADIIKTLKIN